MLKKEKLLSLITNRHLELIIFPTEQCNFRCTYCYEDFSIGKMQPNTVVAIKKLILQRIDNLDSLKLSWFGGEPLAAKNIVFEISEFVQEQRRIYADLKYISDMTTNAYQLNDEVFAKLISLGVTSYQISLDGTEENHNKTRVRMDGAGTFEKIWNNLLSARNSNHDFSIILRLHITPDNLDNMHKLILIKANFSHDKRFTIFFKAIENLGGPNSGSFKVLRGQDKAEILRNLYKQLGDTLKTKKINDKGPYVCYAATTNSFVIRADGKLGKCTVALSDDRNNLGRLLDDGTIEIASDKLALWTRGIKSQNLEDLSCPMHHMAKVTAAIKSIPVVVEMSR
jgi:uncharacterized protein